MTITLSGIAAQGAMLSKKIATMSSWGEMTNKEESKLDPLAKSGYINVISEGGLSSSPLLPPPATHTKNA